MEFFMAMNPPTITHQEKQVHVVNGKPVFYEPAELKAARQKLEAHLGKHVPDDPIFKGVRLITKWLFPSNGKHGNGEYRTTKPDTDFTMISRLRRGLTFLLNMTSIFVRPTVFSTLSIIN